MIILASGSPRRHELLKKLCNNFIVEVSDTQEVQNADNPKTLAVENAKLKASSIAAKHPDAIVIGADTIVVLDGEIFGKPDSVEGAEKMLARLSGRRHEVITGLAICAGGKIFTAAEVTEVFFGEMTAEEIAEKALRIGKDCEIICLTGGEPLLQTDDHLVEVLHQAGFSVHVETNGTQELPEFEIIAWIALSPKEDFVTHAKVIIEAQSEVKLVFREAAGEADRNLREAQIERWAKLSAEDHSLQPCDTGDPARNAELLAETIDYILRHPWWRLSLQTHKLLNIR